MKRVCVFCGSSKGTDSIHVESARAMGAAMAKRGIGLVYGGGAIGLMGELADTVTALGGEVIGVIPEVLMAREVGHRAITELLVVSSMHERKAMMAERADAFIALPGGYGTFEEFCEVVTWVQLGIHNKPCGILNVDGYYDPLLELFDRAVSTGFVSASNRKIVFHASDPEKLLDMVEKRIPAWTATRQHG